MTNLTLSKRPNIVSVLEEIKAAPVSEVKILLPKDPRYWNVIALRTLSEQARAYGKDLDFVAQNERGKNLLAVFRGETISAESGKPGVSFIDRFKAWMQIARWKIIGIAAGAIVLLGGALFAALFYLSEATIIVHFNTSPLVKTATITLDPQISELDSEQMVIPAIPVDVQESGTYEIETTGSKEVGTKAEGEITAYNYDVDSSKSFSDGSILITEDTGLKFLLDGAIEIEEASSSAEGSDRIISPGTVSAGVTAEKIGSDYNIEQRTDLYFEDLDDDFWDNIYARAEEDFSGGESDVVSVVTAQDQEDLLSQSLEEIKSQCSQSLSGKLVGDQKLTGKAVLATPVEQNYTPGEGEEADNLELVLRVRCSTLAYSEEDLNKIWSAKLEDLVPEGFELREDDPKVNVLTVEKPKEGEGILIHTEVESVLAPKVEEERFKEDLVGRSFSDLEAYFSTIPDVNSYELRLWPPLIPGILGRLPFNRDRLHIEFGDSV